MVVVMAFTIMGLAPAGAFAQSSSAATAVLTGNLILDKTVYGPGAPIKFIAKDDKAGDATTPADAIIHYTMSDTPDYYPGIPPSDPGVSSDVYTLAGITAPDQPGAYQIKILATAPGYDNSSVKTLTFYVSGLYVYDQAGNKTVFTMADLDNIAMEEQGVTSKDLLASYAYSGYNTYGSWLPVRNEATNEIEKAQGPTVAGILADCDIDLNAMPSDQLITFKGGDGFPYSLTKVELTAKRYYFPNGNQGTEKGGIGTTASWVGAVSNEPTIIDINNEGRLCFGQVAPSERTLTAMVKMVADGGSITVSSDKPASLSSVKATPSTAASLAWGTSITLSIVPINPVWEMIYYTTGATDADTAYPDMTNADIYNYNTWDKVNRVIKVPAGSTSFTVKAFSADYGKTYSPVQTFAYSAKPSVVAGVKAASASYQSTKLTWTKMTGASGYTIYRSLSKTGTYSAIANVGAAAVSYTNSGVKTGATYYYQVKAYINSDNGKIYGNTSAAVSAKPALSKPAFSLKTGKKATKCTWKATPGASGYVIYRATKKAGAYKAVYTKKSGKAGSDTMKKLTSNKTYYYKMKAYRTVGSVKVYSAFTAVKSCKAK